MADLQSSGGPSNGVSSENLVAPCLSSKRQRRPSVRLGEIGEPSAAFAYESYVRRNKQWRVSDESKFRPSLKCLLPEKRELVNKLSKTRPLMNLGNEDSYENQGNGVGEDKNQISSQNLGSSEGNLDLMESSSGRNVGLKEGGGRRAREARMKRGTKRIVVGSVRSNWVSKINDEVEDEEKVSGDDGLGEPSLNAAVVVETHDGYQDFDPEGSDSPRDIREHSPPQNDSPENINLDPAIGKSHGEEREGAFLCQRNHGKMARTRVSKSRDPGAAPDYTDAIELDAPSDIEGRPRHESNDFLGRDWKGGNNLEKNAVGERRLRSPEDGVRIWLNGLGLSRYAPVFELHEVDEEVLPLLTLEDLKDMGINAVGSRRKMYCAIQKLGKSFT